MNMLQKDYAYIRQEDGYLSGRCELSNDNELETFQNVYEGIEERVWRFDIHIPLPNIESIDSINDYIKEIITIIENMTKNDFNKIIQKHICEMLKEQGRQAQRWENEYNFESENFDELMQKRAKQFGINIEDLMNLDQYLWVINDNLDEDEQYNSTEELDEDDNDYEYYQLYDARGNDICDRIVEYLFAQL